MGVSRWLVLSSLIAAPMSAGAQSPSTPPPAMSPPGTAPAGTAPGPTWPANRESSATVTPDTKVDIGTVRTLDAAHGSMICDMPDGQVTYDVSAIQVFDDAGRPLGAAAALHVGDKVRIIYLINNGAKVKEVWVLPPGQ